MRNGFEVPGFVDEMGASGRLSRHRPTAVRLGSASCLGRTHRSAQDVLPTIGGFPVASALRCSPTSATSSTQVGGGWRIAA